MKFKITVILFIFSPFALIAADKDPSPYVVDWPAALIIVTIIGTIATLFRDYIKSFQNNPKKDHTNEEELSIEHRIELLAKDIEYLQESLKEIKENTQANKIALENTINTINNQLESLRKLLFEYISNGRG